MHTPVLLKEALEGLNIKKDGLYIDATAGEGGHLLEIAKLGGKVLGIDQDADQIKQLAISNQQFNNIKLAVGNFADIESIAKINKFFPVNGILFDLGLSINQIQKSEKGFSYKNLDEPLDMRLSTTFEMTAAKIVNNFNQNELYEIFASYGEEINSLAISKAIVRTRTIKPIEKVGELINIIDQVTADKNNKTYARIFQALRIAVNSELENLKKGIDGSLKILKKKGRLVVISFHSLEDRIVKQFIKKNRLRQINKKLIKSKRGLGFERSAKLRIISYETLN